MEKYFERVGAQLFQAGLWVNMEFGQRYASEKRRTNLLNKHKELAILCVKNGGIIVPYDREHFYVVTFRPRRTRRQYHDLPRKGQGRVKYQVNDELGGFCKGDMVRVKGKYIKQINSIYSNGYLAFKRVKGEPNQAQPKDCQLLERACTMLWEKVL